MVDGASYRELEEGEIVDCYCSEDAMDGASYRELEEGEIVDGEVGVADMDYLDERLERVLGDVDKQPFLSHLANEQFNGSLERLRLGAKGGQYGSFLGMVVRGPSLLFPPAQAQAAVPVDTKAKILAPAQAQAAILARAQAQAAVPVDTKAKILAPAQAQAAVPVDTKAKILAERILAAKKLVKRMTGDVTESEHQALSKRRVITKVQDCGARSREMVWELNPFGVGIYNERAGQQKGGSKAVRYGKTRS